MHTNIMRGTMHNVIVAKVDIKLKIWAFFCSWLDQNQVFLGGCPLFLYLSIVFCFFSIMSTLKLKMFAINY